MLNLTKLIFILSVLFMSLKSYASIIPVSQSELSSDYYMSYGNLDLMWVSSTNTQFLGCDSDLNSINYSDWENKPYTGSDECIYNQLLGPKFHGGGWGFFEDLDREDTLNAYLQALYANEFGSFLLNISMLSDLFFDVDRYVNAFTAWNMTTEDELYVAGMPFDSDLPFMSKWSPEGKDFFDDSPANTLYFRVSENQEIESVPEPSTLMIFALGVIGLAARKRLQQ